MNAARGVAALLLILISSTAQAHDLPMAYISLLEHSVGEVVITTKAPLRGETLPRPVSLELEADCRRRGPAQIETTADNVIRQWRVACARGLAGTRLKISGLDAIRPNAIVHLKLAQGGATYLRADRFNDEITLANEPGTTSATHGLSTYFSLGVEHILTGLDHLLFVLGLVLVIWRSGRGMRALVATITAFTLAHSLTLALATLGVVRLPGAAVEACIAASILLLAVELAGFERRRAQARPMSLTFRLPWGVAFAFGLLHGFGFAGALAETGLPEQAQAAALLFFNLGVEAGQLLFVVLLLLTYYAVRHVLPATRAAALATTATGAIASFWLIERLGVIIGI